MQITATFRLGKPTLRQQAVIALSLWSMQGPALAATPTPLPPVQKVTQEPQSQAPRTTSRVLDQSAATGKIPVAINFLTRVRSTSTR